MESECKSTLFEILSPQTTQQMINLARNLRVLKDDLLKIFLMINNWSCVLVGPGLVSATSTTWSTATSSSSTSSHLTSATATWE